METETRSSRRTDSRESCEFGFIVTLREDYGFIQPWRTRDHVYFDRKEGKEDVDIFTITLA